jgi:hypothetical protein
MKRTEKIKEKGKLVRLSEDTSKELKFLSLVTKRSMSSILTEFINNVFTYALNWKDCTLTYDCLNNQVLITLSGKHALLLTGFEKDVRAEIEKRVETK